MPRRPNVSLLALALLLAGCTAPEEPLVEPLSDDEPAADEPAPTPVVTRAPPRPTPSPTPASPTPASPTPTPSNATGAGTGGSDGAAGQQGASVAIVEGDFTATLAIGQENGVAYYERAAANLTMPRAFPDNATLVATWTPSSPADTTMRIWLTDVDGNSIAAGEGESPLTVEIPGEAFGNATGLEGEAYPSYPGVSVQPRVHFALRVTWS